MRHGGWKRAGVNVRKLEESGHVCVAISQLRKKGTRLEKATNGEILIANIQAFPVSRKAAKGF